MFKSTAYSLLMVTSCVLHCMEPETINFSDIVNAKREQIKTLKAGQKINVTDKDNETLARLIAMYQKNSDVLKAHGTQYKLMVGRNRNNEHGRIEPLIYILRENSYLNENYITHTIGKIPHQQIAHHLEFYKSPQSENDGSIFSLNRLAKTTGYDLNIIYLYKDETAECFELNEEEYYIPIDNQGFVNQVNRINNIVTRYTKLIDITYLNSVQRK
jgi:hypothetical protein